MGSFFIYKCQWPNCTVKVDALDELLLHVESFHVPKDRSFHDDDEVRRAEVPMSYIFSCTNGPVRIRYKRGRSMPDKPTNRDVFMTRIEKECTAEQLHDRFNFDEDDFAAPPIPIIDTEHLMKVEATSEPRRMKTGILKVNARQQESHKCHCGKTYRSSNGLRNHMITYHQARGSQIATDEV